MVHKAQSYEHPRCRRLSEGPEDELEDDMEDELEDVEKDAEEETEERGWDGRSDVKGQGKDEGSGDGCRLADEFLGSPSNFPRHPILGNNRDEARAVGRDSSLIFRRILKR